LNLLDALAKHFTEAGPGGVEYNRADVIRLAIRRLAAEYLPQQKSRPN
jgi:hypothetical protein